MTSASTKSAAAATQYVTFHVGPHLLGIPIDRVQEINRHSDITPVPHAPGAVRGVINLRGEVVTVIDLRTLLAAELTETSSLRSVVIKQGEEAIALLVDSISDVLSVDPAGVLPAPANVGVEDHYVVGVHTTPDRIVVLLNTDELLAEVSL